MNDACQRYAEDPESNAAHLQECADCSALYGALDMPIDYQPMKVEALPVAPWEGADYRPWPLVFGGSLAVLAIALALCAAAGISLPAAISAGARLDWRVLLGAVTTALRPLGPIGFGVLFVVVNTFLVLLLRRAPRGIDA
jgi:hypothetical protein